MSSYVDTIKEFEHARLRDARKAVEAVRSGCVPVIREVVHQYLDTFPPFLGKDRLADEIANRLIAIVQDCCDYQLEVIACLDDLVECLGSPDALRGAADALEANVDNPANDLLGVFDTDGTVGCSTWDDVSPSERYRKACDGQPDELKRLLPLIASLREILREMADQIETFYIELTIAVAGLVAWVAGTVATVATASVGAIPVAIATGIAAMAGQIAVLGGVVALAVTTSQVQGDLLDHTKTDFDRIWANTGEFATVQ